MKCKRLHYCAKCVGAQFRGGELSAWYLENLTTKWWVTSENVTENGMYGQKGILYNNTIWTAHMAYKKGQIECAEGSFP